ncbi:MAG: hypothetical protein AAGU11_17605, partial [Syntrophobacteraceae bacterium]
GVCCGYPASFSAAIMIVKPIMRMLMVSRCLAPVTCLSTGQNRFPVVQYLSLPAPFYRVFSQNYRNITIEL